MSQTPIRIVGLTGGTFLLCLSMVGFLGIALEGWNPLELGIYVPDLVLGVLFYAVGVVACLDK